MGQASSLPERNGKWKPAPRSDSPKGSTPRLRFGLVGNGPASPIIDGVLVVRGPLEEATVMLARAITLVLLLTLAPLANAENLRGVVTSVDASKQELVVEGRGIGKRGKSFTFTLAKDVRILFGDDKGAVTDLARDQTLRITYETKDGALIATTIHVNGSRPAAAKEP